MKSKGVVLLSGGLDSTTAMWSLKKNYSQLYTLTFAYGSKDEEITLMITKHLSEIVGAAHRIIELPWLKEFSKNSGSTLVSKTQVPSLDEGDLDDIKKASETARSVWIPARNLIFLSIASSFAESIGGGADIIAGFDAEEAATFPDNSSEFVNRMNNVIKLAVLEKDIKVVAPLIHLNKTEIADLSLKLGVPVEYTSSCYHPHGIDGEKRPVHCGICESCIRRMRGFKTVGADPTIYTE
jgi:7-cyano-7-deazaguanine synthase